MLPQAGAGRFARFLPLLPLALAAALYAFCFDKNYTGVYIDDARHVLAAKSILSGHYARIFQPDNAPIDNLLPGYPLAAAPFLWLGGIPLVKLLSVVALLAAGWLLFLLPGMAVPALVLLFCPASAELAPTAMTEPLFVFWTVAALYLLDKARWKPTLALALALALFCAFACWIRPEGALFAASAAAVCLPQLDRRNRFVLGAAALLLFAAPYLRNMLLAGTPATYFSELGRGKTVWHTLLVSLDGVKAAVSFYLQAVPGAVFCNPLPSTPFWLALPVICFFWLLLARGTLLALRGTDRLRKASAVYAVLMLGLHLFWVNLDNRYFYPLTPFLALLVFDGAIGLGRLPRRAVMAAAVVLAVAGGARVALSCATLAPGRTVAWLRANTEMSDCLVASRIDYYFLETGRKGYPIYYSSNPDAWYYWLTAKNIRYYIFEGKKLIRTVPHRAGEKAGNADATALRLLDGTRFKNVFFDEEEKTAVFRVTPPEGFASSYAQLRLAQALAASGKRADALAVLRALERNRAPLVRLDFTLGATLLLDGQARPAVAPLERALAAEPGFRLAAEYLARAKQTAAVQAAAAH